MSNAWHAAASPPRGAGATGCSSEATSPSTVTVGAVRRRLEVMQGRADPASSQPAVVSRSTPFVSSQSSPPPKRNRFGMTPPCSKSPGAQSVQSVPTPLRESRRPSGMAPTIPPVVLGVGAGGAEELQQAIADTGVSWALLKFQIGSGTFMRTKLVAVRCNGEKTPVMRRGWYSARANEVLGLLGDVSASLEVTRADELTLDYLCERLLPLFVADDLNFSRQDLQREYARMVENAKQAEQQRLRLQQRQQEDEEHEQRQRTLEAEKLRREALEKQQRATPQPIGNKALQLSADEALRSVASDRGEFNWVVLSPDNLRLHAAGHRGPEEMVDHLNEDMVLFGALRLSFGGGGSASSGHQAARVTKHVFIHWVGSKVGIVRRGKWNARLSEAVRYIGARCSIAFRREVHRGAELSLEELVAELRRLTVIDGVSSGCISVQACRIALAEEIQERQQAEAKAATDRTAAAEKRIADAAADAQAEELARQQAASEQSADASHLLLGLVATQPLPDIRTAVQTVRAASGTWNWVLAGWQEENLHGLAQQPPLAQPLELKFSQPTSSPTPQVPASAVPTPSAAMEAFAAGHKQSSLRSPVQGSLPSSCSNAKDAAAAAPAAECRASPRVPEQPPQQPLQQSRPQPDAATTAPAAECRASPRVPEQPPQQPLQQSRRLPPHKLPGQPLPSSRTPPTTPLPTVPRTPPTSGARPRISASIAALAAGLNRSSNIPIRESPQRPLAAWQLPAKRELPAAQPPVQCTPASPERSAQQPPMAEPLEIPSLPAFETQFFTIASPLVDETHASACPSPSVAPSSMAAFTAGLNRTSLRSPLPSGVRESSQQPPTQQPTTALWAQQPQQLPQQQPQQQPHQPQHPQQQPQQQPQRWAEPLELPSPLPVSSSGAPTPASVIPTPVIAMSIALLPLNRAALRSPTLSGLPTASIASKQESQSVRQEGGVQSAMAKWRAREAAEAQRLAREKDAKQASDAQRRIGQQRVKQSVKVKTDLSSSSAMPLSHLGSCESPKSPQYMGARPLPKRGGA